MLAYSYSSYTGDYVGDIEISEDPNDPGTWLVPGSSTLVAPPSYDPQAQTCRWNGAEWIVAAIVIDPAILIQQQLSQINADRDTALADGIVLNDMIFFADNLFVTELTLILARYEAGILQQTDVVFIRTRNSGTITCDFDTIKALAAAVGDYRQQVFKASWDAKDQIDPYGNYNPPLYSRGADVTT